MIFVFGSNLSGIPGARAAAFALKNKGAIWGQGIGWQGNSYGIPTKDERIRTLPLHRIEEYVNQFLAFASDNPGLLFEVTRIGCGLAGYSDSDIAPMFRNAPSNCILSPEWIEWLKNNS